MHITNRRRLRVGIIGVGRVGAVLGAALAAAGHRIVAASAVSAASLDRAARFLPDTPLVAADEVPRGGPQEASSHARSRPPSASSHPRSRPPDVLLLAVPDDALGPLVRGLAAAGALAPGLVLVHTSGAHGLEVLAPAVAVGAEGIALHPAMTFTGEPRDLDRLAEGACFGVTAPAHLRPLATRLVADLGGSVEWIDDEARPLYHAALAHGANHLVTLVNEALDRLRDAGVGDPQRMAGPLLRAALENTLAHGDAALTGPVSRGDAGTVARHLSVLGQVAPDSVPAYVALARRTADRAIAAGRLRPVDAEPLLGVLSQPVPVAAAAAATA